MANEHRQRMTYLASEAATSANDKEHKDSIAAEIKRLKKDQRRSAEFAGRGSAAFEDDDSSDGEDSRSTSQSSLHDVPEETSMEKRAAFSEERECKENLSTVTEIRSPTVSSDQRQLVITGETGNNGNALGVAGAAAASGIGGPATFPIPAPSPARR